MFLPPAPQVPYRYVDDLATVWCEWAEMELRHNNFKSALDLMQRATAVPQRPRKLSQDEERQLPVQERLYRSASSGQRAGHPLPLALGRHFQHSRGAMEGELHWDSAFNTGGGGDRDM